MLITWCTISQAYTLEQLCIGYNPNSRLEVVSLLNVLSQAHYMYVHDKESMPKYNLKIYLSAALATISNNWIKDEKYPSKTNPNHDESRTQKQVIA